MAASLNGGLYSSPAPAGTALAGEPAARGWEERAVDSGNSGNALCHARQMFVRREDMDRDLRARHTPEPLSSAPVCHHQDRHVISTIVAIPPIKQAGTRIPSVNARNRPSPESLLAGRRSAAALGGTFPRRGLGSPASRVARRLSVRAGAVFSAAYCRRCKERQIFRCCGRLSASSVPRENHRHGPVDDAGRSVRGYRRPLHRSPP